MKLCIFITTFTALLILSASTLPVPAPSIADTAILASTVAASVTPIALALKWWWIKKLVDTAFDRVGQWSFEKFALEKQKYKEGMCEPSWKEMGGKGEEQKG
jgi:hypothetical protein